MKDIRFYRATTTPNIFGKSFTRYGDTIAVESCYDTDIVYNLTTNSTYIYSGEQGTAIKSKEFPLTEQEELALDKFNLKFNWLSLRGQ